jgi:hypothetical protein
MRSWVGTRVREDALTVPCRFCRQREGEPCVSNDEYRKPLEAFPAHTMRISDSRRARECHPYATEEADA